MSTQKGSEKRRKKPVRRNKGFSPIRPNVAGIDLGSREHWVCCPVKGEKGSTEVRRFSTTTGSLMELLNWVNSEGVSSVAMESTSVYWIPLYELLESRGIEAVLVHAGQLKSVPGRKTDILDCQWIQVLHSCGLLKGSFRPSEKICALRAIQREMGNLISERVKTLQWMQKALDQMNVQVHRAVSDLSGKTGMLIVRAIVNGQRSPSELACFRDKRCRKSEKEFIEYLTGTWREEHLFNLEKALKLYDYLCGMIEEYEKKLTEMLDALSDPDFKDSSPEPLKNVSKSKSISRNGDDRMRTALYRLSGRDLISIDGISISTAQVVLSEVGPDLSCFPREKQFISWLRLSPNMAVSAGRPLKKKSKGTGSTRIARALRMGASTLQNSKTALGAYYRKVSRRKGTSIAIFATARKLAQYIYRMLRYGQAYVDEGAEAYEERYRARRLKGLAMNAKQLGYEIVPIAKSG